jgi:tetratricopeptide (TPR) repeat protein
MITRHPALFCSALCLILAVSACTHTPPGTSVELALAKRAEVVRLPPTPAPVVVPEHSTTSHAVAQGGDLPVGEVPTEKTEQVADAFSRAKFCMEAGKDEEAIAAFQEVVKLDPTFVDAWNYLAALYEKTGQDKMALLAFKKSKTTH